MMKKMFLMALTFSTLSACAVGPDYARPEFHVNNWIETENNKQINLTWWEEFKDPILNSLVKYVANSNLDIASAQARVLEARAARQISRASLLPNIGVNGAFSRAKQSQNDPQLVKIPGVNIPQIQESYTAGFDASWEIDIFGGNRRALEAASARVESAEAFQHNVVLTVIAETARNYIELRGLQKRVDLLKRNADLQKQTVDLIKASHRIGLSREIDIARAQALLTNTQSLIPNIEAEIRSASYRLSVLTGQQPGTLLDSFEKSKPLPAPNEVVPLGLKSDLLRRRPDIQVAERNLAAATADVGVSVAELYPSFSMTGTLGLLSGDYDELFKSASETFLFSPLINMPIFEGGRFRANINAAEARNSQAAIAYEQTVLNALEEAESALVKYAKEQETRAHLRKSVKSLRRSVQLRNTLYEKGLIKLIDVLNIERELINTEDSLVRSETRVSTNLISLYKSLGGGWEVFQQDLPQNANLNTKTEISTD